MYFRTTFKNMLDSCLLRFFFLLVLLQLIHILSTTPQVPRYPIVSRYWSSGTKNEFAGNPVFPGKFNGTQERKRQKTNNAGVMFLDIDSDADDIGFSGTVKVGLKSIARIDGPPKCARGTTFCEHFELYPYWHMKDILQKQQVSNKEFFFGQDEIPLEVKKRIGLDEETFLCDTVSRLIFPKVAKNKHDKWRFIVNQDQEEGYVQGVHIETCRNPDRSCNIIGDLPEGYRTFCKQKYSYRRFLSLSDDGKSFIPDTFVLPSACCCSYGADDFLARIAVAKG